MHDARRIVSRRARSFIVAVTLAVMVATGTGMARTAMAGEYNLNPAYCHQHSAWDPLWWIYQCWLPDPPGGEIGRVLSFPFSVHVAVTSDVMWAVAA